MRRQGIVHEVSRRIGGAQGYGDHEIGGSKTQEHKDKYLTAPLRKEPLEHGDASLAVGARLCHTLVKRQGGKQRNQHEYKSRQRREDARRQECDAWLVTQG